MLKKSAAILLASLYLVTVSGFALNLHYCFNQLASIQIDAPAKTCMNGPQARKMNCCKDKHIEVKVKDVHQHNPWHFTEKMFITFLPLPILPNFIAAIVEVSSSQPAYRGPPLSFAVPAYLANRNFRI